MSTSIHDDIKEILRLQYEQTKELSAIKSYQLTHKDRIECLEIEASQNTAYRHKSKGFIGAIYIIIGIFGGAIAKKFFT